MTAPVLRPALLCATALAAALLALPLIGSAPLDLAKALAGDPVHSTILHLRLSRVLLAALSGGALAVAGLLFQALVRDSLADPYTLGVSSGSSLGAVISIFFRLEAYRGVAALAGAVAVLSLNLALASRGRRLSSLTLLLAGVTVNSVAIAVVLLFHSLADYGQSFQMMRWLMGGIESPDYATLALLAAVLLPVVGFVYARSRDWNLLAVGDTWAESHGVASTPALRNGFLAGSVLTAAVTCLTGPIGFLGWMVPHALRLWLGADLRTLIPSAFLAGACFLAVCDTVARTALAPTEIPIGAITAILAGPFFLWLLGKRSRGLWL